MRFRVNEVLDEIIDTIDALGLGLWTIAKGGYESMPAPDNFLAELPAIYVGLPKVPIDNDAYDQGTKQTLEIQLVILREWSNDGDWAKEKIDFCTEIVAGVVDSEILGGLIWNDARVLRVTSSILNLTPDSELFYAELGIPVQIAEATITVEMAVAN